MSSRHSPSGRLLVSATIIVIFAGLLPLSGEARYQNDTSPTPVSIEGVCTNGTCSSNVWSCSVSFRMPSFRTVER